MKKYSAFGIVLALTLLIIGCGSGSNDSNTASGKRYLARNVIYNPDLVRAAYADSNAIDTETQILAENVVFERSSESNIESENVQEALEEVSLKLAEIIVGTWNIQNYNQEDQYETTGRITINSDRSFNLSEGALAAIGITSGTSVDPWCGHEVGNQTYEVFTDELIVFKFIVNGVAIPYEQNSIPRLIKLRRDEIIFVGSGGCGISGRERISVLTRVTE